MRKIVFLIPLLLTACAVGPDYAMPRIDLPNWWHAHAAAPELRETEAPQPTAWWKAFHDKELDRLIGRALAAERLLVAAH